MKDFNEPLAKQIIFIKVEDDVKVREYADLLLKGNIVCFDFTDCPKDQATVMISFLSGINYATDGIYKRIKGNIFLYGLKEHFKDQSIKEFIQKVTRV